MFGAVGVNGCSVWVLGCLGFGSGWRGYDFRVLGFGGSEAVDYWNYPRGFFSIVPTKRFRIPWIRNCALDPNPELLRVRRLEFIRAMQGADLVVADWTAGTDAAGSQLVGKRRLWIKVSTALLPCGRLSSEETLGDQMQNGCWVSSTDRGGDAGF